MSMGTVGASGSELPQPHSLPSLAGGIRTAMQRNPSKIALQDSNGTRSYRQLVERIDRITQGFVHDLALGMRDRVAILAGNSIEYIEITVGASQAGVALAKINPRLSNEEVISICDDAQARVLFVDAGNAERVRDCRFASVERIIGFGPELESWIAGSNPTWPPAQVPGDSVFIIPYTSGTTGRPKGVMISHQARLLLLYAMAVEYGCYSSDDRFLAIAPLCHGAGITFALAPLYFGGFTRVMERFDPEAVLKACTDERISGVFMVPTHFHGIFAQEERLLAKYRHHGLQTIISNAAPLPQATKERIVEYFGDGLLHECYGSTEAGIVTNLRPGDQLIKQNCVGLPFTSTLVKIADEQGNECAVGELGELFSQSPFLFDGYLNNPGETAGAVRDGWVTVGDLARRDRDGYIYIADRKKDMIISGGVNIYPREIENVLNDYPGITEAGVIGVPDDRWGERLKAFIVAEPGERFDYDKVVDYCAARLARFKVPREFEAIDKLPRNTTGKLLKQALRERTT